MQTRAYGLPRANCASLGGDMGEHIPFSKWHGAGNDYVFVELSRVPSATAHRLIEMAPALARRLSAQHTGIGADGLVLLDVDAGVDLRLLMFNGDGSRGALCGNALRCVGTGLHSGHFGSSPGRSTYQLASDSGVHEVRIAPAGSSSDDAAEVARATVAIGRPRFEAERIPLDPSRTRVFSEGGTTPWEIALDAAGEIWEGLALSMGNPHLVLPLVHSPAELDLAVLGPPLEAHPAFPERVNASFVRLAEDGAIEQRTFERGTGETAACGSGACASVVALTYLLDLPRGVEQRVRMPGGELRVTIAEDGMVWLGGPIERVFWGHFELDAEGL